MFVKDYLFPKNLNFIFTFDNEKKIFTINNKIKNYKNLINLKEISKIETFKKIINKFLISSIRGYITILEIIGLGYSVTCKNNVLRLNVGYNHSIYFPVSLDVNIRSKRKIIFLFSHSFFILKNTVVTLKNFRKLSIYKLKGIKEKDELYFKKNWKKNIL